MTQILKKTCSWWIVALLLAATACSGGPDRKIVPPQPPVEEEGSEGDGPSAPTGLCINEVNTREKYIELYNPGTTPCDLSGIRIRKNGGGFLQNADKSGDFAVAAGTTLEAGGFALLNCKGSANRHPGLDLGVSATGISGGKSLLLELVGPDGERLDYFVNSSYAAPRGVDAWDAAVEHEFDVAGRHGDASAAWYLLTAATPGASNASASRGLRFTHATVDFESTTPNTPAGGTTTGGADYVFDMDALPEVRITVTPEEWNALLTAFDANNNTEEYIRCTASFAKGEAVHRIEEAGLRLRGNTSRRRPEGNGGEMHRTDNPDYHHCHFMLNLRKYVKDDAHTIGGVRKIHLKWFKDDPTYVREIYSFDLFRRYGIWTALRSSYCRLWIEIEGDLKPAYFGVYAMLEAIDDEFVEARPQFGDPKHNLWKCAYGADLRSGDDWRFGVDQGDGSARPYELKTNEGDFETAKAQLQDFIAKVQGKTGESFRTWIASVCDVELLLKTYAVNVVLGMWDDYWNNSNNYYLYFNSSDRYDYRVFMIPYDYDNTLGTSNHVGAQSDAGRQDPLHWGPDDNPLIAKILETPEWRQTYLDALRELVDGNELFGMTGSMQRIGSWQAMIEPYVDNDTGEDCRIYDAPASWGNHPEYRLMDTGSDNFFRVKAASIPR